MSRPRQQRAPRNRRIISPNAPAITGTLAPVVASIALGTLDLQGLIIAQPPQLSGTAVPLVLTGQPKIRRARDSSLPTVWTLLPDGLTLRLEYAPPVVDATDSFWVGPDDPNVRTPTGGFLAPGVIDSPTPLPPEITPATISGVATGPSEITVTVSPGAGLYTVFIPSSWFHAGAPNTPSAASVAAPTGAGVPFDVVLTFPGAITPGDQINYSGPPLAVGNTGINTITTTPVVIT